MSCARGWGSAVPADHLDTVALDTSVTLATSTPEREPLSRRSSMVFATALAMSTPTFFARRVLRLLVGGRGVAAEAREFGCGSFPPTCETLRLIPGAALRLYSVSL